MKIRNKITLWITGTALLSTLVFSIIIFFELVEEPFKLIDKELQHMTQSIIKQMEQPDLKQEYTISRLPYPPDLFWIKVTDQHENILYRSPLTRFTDIPLSGDKSIYMLEKNIPKSEIQLGQDDGDDVLFRVMVSQTRVDGFLITVQIAKPIESLEEELIELAKHMLASLMICILILFFISYILAGRILNPLVTITRMSKDITENSLHKRIPLNKNKDELYDLCMALNKMFDRLQYSFQRQKEFIGNASHELKSPITLLMLAQEDMLINGTLPTLATRQLIKQLDTSRRMSHLVRNLLDLSRLEQHVPLVKTQVNLTDMVNKVLEDYSALFQAKEIDIKNKLPQKLNFQGDREKLTRLFINLIDNSANYNLTNNGSVLLKGGKVNQNIFIEISNTGPPIPQTDITRLFEQFYRVEKSRSDIHGGSGLGLAIAKKIVELHEGTITIGNTSNSLIKVGISLPADRV
ncbi:MAG: HAMP domain-containing histidine kinase [Desulfobacula sp.]|nr:HAMP domain-containing histidine kinase [Desulfobacula sp.]